MQHYLRSRKDRQLELQCRTFHRQHKRSVLPHSWHALYRIIKDHIQEEDERRAELLGQGYTFLEDYAPRLRHVVPKFPEISSSSEYQQLKKAVEEATVMITYDKEDLVKKEKEEIKSRSSKTSSYSQSQSWQPAYQYSSLNKSVDSNRSFDSTNYALDIVNSEFEPPATIVETAPEEFEQSSHSFEASYIFGFDEEVQTNDVSFCLSDVMESAIETQIDTIPLAVPLHRKQTQLLLGSNKPLREITHQKDKTHHQTETPHVTVNELDKIFLTEGNHPDNKSPPHTIRNKLRTTPIHPPSAAEMRSPVTARVYVVPNVVKNVDNLLPLVEMQTDPSGRFCASPRNTGEHIKINKKVIDKIPPPTDRPLYFIIDSVSKHDKGDPLWMRDVKRKKDTEIYGSQYFFPSNVITKIRPPTVDDLPSRIWYRKYWPIRKPIKNSQRTLDISATVTPLPKVKQPMDNLPASFVLTSRKCSAIRADDEVDVVQKFNDRARTSGSKGSSVVSLPIVPSVATSNSALKENKTRCLDSHGDTNMENMVHNKHLQKNKSLHIWKRTDMFKSSEQ